MQSQLKNWGHVDNRQRVRFQHDAQVEIRFHNNAIVFGQLRDISLEGLYFYTWQNFDQTVPLHSKVTVKLLLTNGHGSVHMELESIIVRIDQQGIALRFTHPFQFLPIFSLVLQSNTHNSSGKKYRSRQARVELLNVQHLHRAAA